MTCTLSLCCELSGRERCHLWTRMFATTRHPTSRWVAIITLLMDDLFGRSSIDHCMGLEFKTNTDVWGLGTVTPTCALLDYCCILCFLHDIARRMTPLCLYCVSERDSLKRLQLWIGIFLSVHFEDETSQVLLLRTSIPKLMPSDIHIPKLRKMWAVANTCTCHQGIAQESGQQEARMADEKSAVRLDLPIT